MNPNLSDWDDDLLPEPEEVYQGLLRPLKRNIRIAYYCGICIFKWAKESVYVTNFHQKDLNLAKMRSRPFTKRDR
ncbi:hypothetical protein [Nostoc sp.]|uniref:hypothetical protein n=1 Tax=Nostoc sp. TaxID=1180 RepID=UPI002FF4E318